MSAITTACNSSQPPTHNSLSQITLLGEPNEPCNDESIKAKRSPASPVSASTSGHEQPLRHPFSSLTPQVAPVLENSGTAARDHLANERTWLAYIRTSLAVSGAGVALVQLFTKSPAAAPSLRLARGLGAATVALGLIILAIGVLRFFKIQKAMIRGFFPTARGGAVLITAALAALVATTFAVLIASPLE